MATQSAGQPNTASKATVKQRLRAWWNASPYDVFWGLRHAAGTAIGVVGLFAVGYVAGRVWAAAGGDTRIEGTLIGGGFWVLALALFLRRTIGLLRARSTVLRKVAAPLGAARLRGEGSGVMHREARHAALHIVVGWRLGFIITSSDIRDTSCLYGWSFNASNSTGADARFAGITLHLAGLTEGEPVTLSQSRDAVHAVSLATELIAAGERPSGYEGVFEIGGLIEAAASNARAIVAEEAGLIAQIASVHARTHFLDERLIAELLTPFLADSARAR